MDYSNALVEVFGRVDEVAELLLDDTSRCATLADELLTNAPTAAEKKQAQFVLRQFVRTALAEIDGVTRVMCDGVLRLHNHGFVALTEEQVGYLSPFNRDQKLATRSIDALQAFALAYGVKIAPAFADPRWEDFQQAIRLRNRMTHPTSLQSLRLRPDESQRLLRGLTWFHEQLHRTLTACAGAIPSQTDRTSAVRVRRLTPRIWTPPLSQAVGERALGSGGWDCTRIRGL